MRREISYFGLANVIARRFHIAGYDHDDLVQEAQLAMVRDAPNFDPSRAQLSTFLGRRAEYHLKDLLKASLRRPAEVGLPDTLADHRSDPALIVEQRDELRIAIETGENPYAVNRDHRLTPMQLTVLQRVAAGETNDEIASALGMAVETAKSHLKALLHKLGAKNRTHAVWRGLELGLLTAPRTEPRLSGDPVPHQEREATCPASEASSPSSSSSPL